MSDCTGARINARARALVAMDGLGVAAARGVLTARRPSGRSWSFASARLSRATSALACRLPRIHSCMCTPGRRTFAGVTAWQEKLQSGGDVRRYLEVRFGVKCG